LRTSHGDYVHHPSATWAGEWGFGSAAGDSGSDTPEKELHQLNQSLAMAMQDAKNRDTTKRLGEHCRRRQPEKSPGHSSGVVSLSLLSVVSNVTCAIRVRKDVLLR